MTNLQKRIEQLLVIANVPPEKMDEARRRLNWSISAAHQFSKNYREQLNPQEHNECFDAIEKSAASLIAAIKHVDTNEYASLLLWWGWHEHEPWREAPERVFGTLDRIVKAARDARIGKTGRPLLRWKQELVDQAYVAFESMKSPELRANEYSAGPFYLFAKTFCDAAQGKDVGSITLQVRKVLKKSRSQGK